MHRKTLKMKRTKFSSVLPKYYQVKLAIAQDIAVQGMKVGDRLPGEHALARKHRVAYLTARRAMEELIAEGVVSRALGQRARVAMIPRMADASPLPAGRKQEISIIGAWGTTRPGIFAPPSDVVAHFVAEGGNVSRLVTMANPTQYDTELREALASGAADGAVLVGFHHEKAARIVFESGLPAVFVDYAPVTVPVDGVVTDNRAIAGRLFGHLWDLGHRRIDFIGHEPHDRRDAGAEELAMFWRRFVDDWQGTGTAHWCRTDMGDNTTAIAAAIAQATDAPTALMVSNMQMATAVAAHLRKAGWAVPADISLVTVNAAMTERDATFTGVVIDWYELARLAVRQLQGIMAGTFKRGARVCYAGLMVDHHTTAAPGRKAKNH